MKIVQILGGLGNQMFQYAFYKALKNLYSDVKLDISAFDKYEMHNGFELNNIFKIDRNYTTKKERNILSYQGGGLSKKILKKIFKYKKTEFTEPYLGYFDNMLHIQGDAYFIGYWQSYKYFSAIEDKIREQFIFPQLITSKNLDIIAKIKNSNSISIHIRRGDYINNPLYSNICTLEYYNKAIAFFKQKVDNPVFYIFSNDIKWCSENLLVKENSYFIDWNKGTDSFWDIYLMSLCKHNIIANSSFSWWGGWLNSNDNKIVVGPSKWLNDERININDILLPEWVSI